MADTKRVNLTKTHIYAGKHYGPGSDIEVPAGLKVHYGSEATKRAAPKRTAPDTAKVSKEKVETQGTELPEQFPGRDELVGAGVLTIEAVVEKLESIEDIDGIGPATAKDIAAALDELTGGAG